MENASKALIIAGAILLSILIIGLGMLIFNQAKDAIGDTGMDKLKIKEYNQPFLDYEGTQSGTNARQLYNEIKSHNRSNVDDPSQQISVVVNETAVDKVTPETGLVEPPTTVVSLGANNLKTGITYYVYFQYSKSGYITKCVITALK